MRTLALSMQADTRNSIEAIHADISAVQSDMQANIGAVQAETRGALETIGAFQAEVLHIC